MTSGFTPRRFAEMAQARPIGPPPAMIVASWSIRILVSPCRRSTPAVDAVIGAARRADRWPCDACAQLIVRQALAPAVRGIGCADPAIGPGAALPAVPWISLAPGIPVEFAATCAPSSAVLTVM